MNPNKVKPQIHRLKINHPSEIVAIQFSLVNSNLLFAVTKQAELLKVNWKENKILETHLLEKTPLNWEESIAIKANSSDEYLSIVNQYGGKGYVYDLKEHQVIFQLDRKEYHIKQSKFPILFYKHFIIHNTDWNHLEITNLQTKQTITTRDTNVYKEEGQRTAYLDYFYGELHFSPNQEFILSSGWVWNPVSVLKVINFKNWLEHNIAEPETENSGYGITCYYWDRALCWLDNEEIAFLYDPREEDLDEEDGEEMKIEINKPYIFYYNQKHGDISKRIRIDEYPKNDYHEAKPDCRLFFIKDTFILSSKDQALKIINPENGKTEFEIPDLYLENRIQNSNRFYTLKENNSIDIVSFN